MMEEILKTRALGLSSGGLDSILSGLVLRSQGILVEWVTFETPFFEPTKAIKASKLTKIPLTVKNITHTYLKMLVNPRCGYGQHMNPCLDCHALMFQLAGDLMKKRGFDFLFSGEVLGQRPMSQTRPSLRYVEKQSGFAGYILRPLSAKSLDPTIPEKKGWVIRDKLLGITGRSRKEQIKLAESFGVREYPAPAGGCLLTDKGYSDRLKDLFKHQTGYTENELHLLKYGRHFRINKETKIIVGRTEKENDYLKKYYSPTTDKLIKLKDFPGPTALLPGTTGKEASILAGSICVGYSKVPAYTPAKVVVNGPNDREIIEVIGILPLDIKHLLI